MNNPNRRPSDDVSSAPESGTVRDDTSGNQTARPNDRPAPAANAGAKGSGSDADRQKDDPAVAGEER
ncbi:hypothetical protein [Gemmata sp.]|uniref:hypothetical protein n=1 Tax=Gemmata sp. TaxID=1914242 RepID=UPI003F6FF709